MHSIILFDFSLLLAMFKGNMDIEASLGFEMLLTEVTNVLDSLNVGVDMLENVGFVVMSSATLDTFPLCFTVSKIYLAHQTHFQTMKIII